MNPSHSGAHRQPLSPIPSVPALRYFPLLLVVASMPSEWFQPVSPQHAAILQQPDATPRSSFFKYEHMKLSWFVDLDIICFMVVALPLVFMYPLRKYHISEYNSTWSSILLGSVASILLTVEAWQTCKLSQTLKGLGDAEFGSPMARDRGGDVVGQSRAMLVINACVVLVFCVQRIMGAFAEPEDMPFVLKLVGIGAILVFLYTKVRKATFLKALIRRVDEFLEVGGGDEPQSDSEDGPKLPGGVVAAVVLGATAAVAASLLLGKMVQGGQGTEQVDFRSLSDMDARSLKDLQCSGSSHLATGGIWGAYLMIIFYMVLKFAGVGLCGATVPPAGGAFGVCVCIMAFCFTQAAIYSGKYAAQKLGGTCDGFEAFWRGFFAGAGACLTGMGLLKAILA